MKEEKKEGEGDEKEGEEKEKEKEASEGSEVVKNTNSTWGVITVESGMESFHILGVSWSHRGAGMS